MVRSKGRRTGLVIEGFIGRADLLADDRASSLVRFHYTIHCFPRELSQEQAPSLDSGQKLIMRLFRDE